MIELLKRLLGKRPAINFRELINKGAVVVDVRTPDEFKAGHFPKSRNIPLDQVSGKLEELKKTGKAAHPGMPKRHQGRNRKTIDNGQRNGSA